MFKRYEKPTLIDLDFKSAQGICSPTGSADAVRCNTGNAAADCNSSGNSATAGCTPHGNIDAVTCSGTGSAVLV